jgi:ATP-binding cassette subfamily C (CFTR/MRP) protein 1
LPIPKQRLCILLVPNVTSKSKAVQTTFSRFGIDLLFGEAKQVTMAIFCTKNIPFGRLTKDCPGGADFTVFFEELAFGLIAQCIFLILAAIRASQLRRRAQRIRAHFHLGRIKLAIGLAFVLSTIVLLILNSISPNSMLSIATASVEVVGSAGIAYLSTIEHHRTIRPSQLLQLFLSLFLLFDIARLRTMFLRQFQSSILSTMLLRTFLTLLILILESFNKKHLVIAEDSAPPLGPEDTGGLFQKRFLWNLNTLFKKGTVCSA